MRAGLRRTGWAALAAAIALGAAACAFIPTGTELSYRYAGSFGTAGTGPGQFQDPTGLAVGPQRIFVSDGRQGRIQVFGRAGTFRRSFGELGRPMNLALRNNRLYVPDYFRDEIAVFEPAGKRLKTLTPAALDSPGGVAPGPDGLWVANTYGQQILRMAKGEIVRRWGKAGETGWAASAFNYPTDVARHPGGGFVVADGYNDRLQRFGPAGRLRAKWGGPWGLNLHGPFPGWFATVTSVAVGPAGRIFAADFYNHRIQVFSPDGDFLTAFGTQGSGAGQFEHALAVAVAADGTVYASDLGNQRVQIWKPVPTG